MIGHCSFSKAVSKTYFTQIPIKCLRERLDTNKAALHEDSFHCETSSAPFILFHITKTVAPFNLYTPINQIAMLELESIKQPVIEQPKRWAKLDTSC